MTMEPVAKKLAWSTPTVRKVPINIDILRQIYDQDAARRSARERPVKVRAYRA